MADLTLDQLIASLESDIIKSAEESCDDKDEKDEKKDEGSKDGGDKKLPPWLKDKGGEKSESKDEDKDDEKSESKDEDKKDEGQEKSAMELGAALAREIMEKAASVNLESVEMNKQTKLAGKTLADALLANLQKSAAVKKANAGDATVVDGNTAPGTVPGKIQADNAQMVAEQNATIKPMVTGDGQTNQGTINEIFDAMVQDALAQGAAGEEQVHNPGMSEDEGAVEDHAVPNQVKEAEFNDEIEKAAAIQELVYQGINFEDAVELVKQAADEIAYEMEKSAAVVQLVNEGVDFDEAIELVKEASAGDATVVDGGPADGAVGDKNQADSAQQVAEQDATIKPMPTGNGQVNGGTLNQIFDGIVQDALAQGAAGEEQVHAQGMSVEEGKVEEHAVPNQVKMAAVSRMVEAGVDFDEAVEFVKQAGELAKEASLAGMARRAQRVMQVGTGRIAQRVSRVAKKIDPRVATGEGAIIVTPSGTAMGPATGAARNAVVNAADKVSANAKAGWNKIDKPGVRLGLAGAGGLAVGAGGAALAGREKKAALEDLIEAGIEFDEAVELVKAAGRVDQVRAARAAWSAARFRKVAPTSPAHLQNAINTSKQHLGAVGKKLQDFGARVKDEVQDAHTIGEMIVNPSKYGKPAGGAKGMRLAALDAAGKNKVWMGGAAAAGMGVGAGGVALAREKKAAFDALVEAGVDFGEAFELVEAKAQELYGK